MSIAMAYIFGTCAFREIVRIIIHNSQTSAFFFGGAWGGEKNTPCDGG
jgi:hypothetical protein